MNFFIKIIFISGLAFIASKSVMAESRLAYRAVVDEEKYHSLTNGIKMLECQTCVCATSAVVIFLFLAYQVFYVQQAAHPPCSC